MCLLLPHIKAYKHTFGVWKRAPRIAGGKTAHIKLPHHTYIACTHTHTEMLTLQLKWYCCMQNRHYSRCFLLFFLLGAEAMTINKVIAWCAQNFSVHHCGFGWCFLVAGIQEIQEQSHNLSPYSVNTHTKSSCTKSINIYDNLSM